MIERVIQTRIDNLLTDLRKADSLLEKRKITDAHEAVKQSLKHIEEMEKQLSFIKSETKEHRESAKKNSSFHYPSSPLTARELEVLTLIRKGLSNKQIAEQLFLAERTIKFHITSILSKLIANNRTEAINNAIQRGILNSQ